MKTIQKCKILSINEIAENIFDTVVESGQIASETKPGQFLHIDCGDGAQNLLRRPISVCNAYDDKVRFIFEKKGSGTQYLSERKAGDLLDILGPLGNGFNIKKDKKSVIIGGGIGVFPLYMLAKNLEKPSVILGFRSKDRVCMENEFSNIAETAVATDDGSYGYNGYAVELLIEKIGACDIVYSCGPLAMLKAVKNICERYSIECQLSLEERMGCGIGACLTCTCETLFEGKSKNRRVCKDGPVFLGSEVVFDG